MAGQREEDIVERRATDTQVFHLDAGVIEGSSRSDQHFAAPFDGSVDLFEVEVQSGRSTDETRNEGSCLVDIVAVRHAYLQEVAAQMVL